MRAKYSVSSTRIAPAFSGARGARDSESVVRVLEFRRNAGTRRRARDLNMMTPGATPRSPAAAALWPQRISFRRAPVGAVVVPIGAPFLHVVAKVEQPINIRRIHTPRLLRHLPPAP